MIWTLLIAVAAAAPAADADVRTVIAVESEPATSEVAFANCVFEADSALAYDIVSAKTQEDFEGAMNLATAVCPFEGSMSLGKLNNALLALFPDFDSNAEEGAE